MLMAAFGLSAVFTIVFPFTTHWVGLAIAARVLFGMAQGPAHPTFVQIISDWFPHYEKSLMYFLVCPYLMILYHLGVAGLRWLEHLIRWDR